MEGFKVKVADSVAYQRTNLVRCEVAEGAFVGWTIKVGLHM